MEAKKLAKIIEELDEVSRDLWNAGKLNPQARTLERISKELGAGGWISVADGLPEVGEDGTARVWAVYEGAGRFVRPPHQGCARFHESLGWQPDNSTGWDWNVTHWRYFPALP